MRLHGRRAGVHGRDGAGGAGLQRPGFAQGAGRRRDPADRETRRRAERRGHAAVREGSRGGGRRTAAGPAPRGAVPVEGSRGAVTRRPVRLWGQGGAPRGLRRRPRQRGHRALPGRGAGLPRAHQHARARPGADHRERGLRTVPQPLGPRPLDRRVQRRLSRGRVPMWPEMAEGWGGMVVQLAVSRSVRDTAAMLDVASGPCPGDLHTPPAPRRPYLQEVGADPGRLRIGVLTSAPDPSVTTHPECVAAAEATARLLESLGHTVEPSYPEALSDPDISQAFLPCYGTWTALELDWWGGLLGRPLTPEDVEPATWAVAEVGRGVSGVQFVAALSAVHQYSARVQRWWAEGWDLLLTPTISEPPPALGEFAAQPDNPFWPVTRSIVEVVYTIPFNMTGQPAISLPLHWTAGGLPVGSQLVAAYGREDLLLRVAAQLEQARPWAKRLPGVHA